MRLGQEGSALFPVAKGHGVEIIAADEPTSTAGTFAKCRRLLCANTVRKIRSSHESKISDVLQTEPAFDEIRSEEKKICVIESSVAWEKQKPDGKFNCIGTERSLSK